MQRKSYAVATVDGMPASALVHVLKDGTFAKCAEGLPDQKTEKPWWVGRLEPKKGNLYIVVISQGAGEYYGPNVWGDYFNEGERELTGIDVPAGRPKTIKLDGGIKKYHKLFTEIGGAYRHHMNGAVKNPLTGKPYPKLGNIVLERYNENAHRGELLLELPLDGWFDVAKRYEEDDPTTWSMSCGVPHDICTRCLTKAKDREHGCDCLRHNMMEITPGGDQIVAVNDTTYYHDISFVDKNPAYKLCFTIQKAASAGLRHQFGGVTRETLMDAGLWLPLETVRRMSQTAGTRYELLQKLAAAERATKQEKPPAGAYPDSDGKDTEHLLKVTDQLPGELPDVLAMLTEAGILVPPKTFACILIRRTKPEPSAATPSWVDLVPGEAKGVFDKIETEPGLKATVVEDGAYPESTHMVPPSDARLGLSVLRIRFSPEPDAVRNRIIEHCSCDDTDADTKMQRQKKASGPVTDADLGRAQAVAVEYAKYLLSFAGATRVSPECLVRAKL